MLSQKKNILLLKRRHSCSIERMAIFNCHTKQDHMDQLLSNRHLFENSLLQALLEEGGTPFGLTLLNQEGYLIFVNQVAALHYNLQKELVSDHLHFQHLFSALADLRKTVTSCLEGQARAI